jgi:hydroxymethylpyrimidine pyrophosphatase-like HAD family hydrolase
MKETIAVDLDGTLAHYNGYEGEDVIGRPIKPMLRRVRNWITDGKTVVIFTARASRESAIQPIKDWLKENGIGGLEVTNEKRPDFVSIYDDRAVQVRRNTGQLVRGDTKS